jgi:hypothetical protein
MNDLFEEDWSDSMAGINERALETNAKDTNQVMQSLFNSSKQARDRRLSSIIQQGASLSLIVPQSTSLNWKKPVMLF